MTASSATAQRFIPALDTAALDRELIKKRGLRAFVRRAWSELETAKYIHGWHIDAICDHLEAVSRGQINRLIINIPPGCMKSLLVSVFWPAWEWTFAPNKKWMYASHEESLALRDSRKVRNLVESPWWADRWPEVFLPLGASTAAKEFSNNKSGMRLTTSIGGRGIGWHAHRQVVDDPHKPLDLQGTVQVSKHALDEACHWWQGTMSMRRADPSDFARVIVMQRLHTADLSGQMISDMTQDDAAEKYEVLCLPMEFEAKRKCVTSVGADQRTKEGELLWPGRFPADVVPDLKRGLKTSRNVASQMQQRPAPAGGNIIKDEWIRHWGVPGTEFERLPPLEKMRFVQSWDFKFKDHETNSWVVGQVWGFFKFYAFLLDQVRGQWGFSKSLEQIRLLSSRWPQCWSKLIEDKANGPAIANVLQGEIPGIVLVNPDGSKEERVHAVEPVFEAGVVYVPPIGNAHPWVQGWIDEVTQFPATTDDQVDCTTQALKELAIGDRLEELRMANAAMSGGG